MAMLKNDYFEDLCNSSDPEFLTNDKRHRVIFAMHHDIIDQELRAMPEVVAGQPDPDADKRKRLNELLESFKKVVKDLDEGIEKSSTKFSLLDLPTFGDNDEYEDKSLRLWVPFFDPKSSDSFKYFWMKLTSYVELKGLSEVAFKSCLGNSLQGKAFKLYITIHDKPLKEIKDILESTYVGFNTKVNLKNEFLKSKREPGQSLGQFIGFMQMDINEGKFLTARSDIAREVERERLLEDKLFKNCSSVALAAIRKAEKKADKKHKELSFEDKLEIAIDAEQEERQKFP